MFHSFLFFLRQLFENLAKVEKKIFKKITEGLSGMKVTFTGKIKPRYDDSNIPLAVQKGSRLSPVGELKVGNGGWPITTSMAQQVSYVSVAF